MQDFTNPSDEDIRAILTGARTIAVVGASSNPDRSSHGIMKKLLSVGYTVIPVNPNETEVLGQEAYRSLSEIPFPVDIVNVFRRAEDTPPIAQEAAACGAETLWLQSGIINQETAAIAKAARMKVIMDRCIGVEHSQLRVPPIV